MIVFIDISTALIGIVVIYYGARYFLYGLTRKRPAFMLMGLGLIVAGISCATIFVRLQ